MGIRESSTVSEIGYWLLVANLPDIWYLSCMNYLNASIELFPYCWFWVVVSITGIFEFWFELGLVLELKLGILFIFTGLY